MASAEAPLPRGAAPRLLPRLGLFKLSSHSVHFRRRCALTAYRSCELQRMNDDKPTRTPTDGRIIAKQKVCYRFRFWGRRCDCVLGGRRRWDALCVEELRRLLQRLAARWPGRHMLYCSQRCTHFLVGHLCVHLPVAKLFPHVCLPASPFCVRRPTAKLVPYVSDSPLTSSSLMWSLPRRASRACVRAGSLRVHRPTAQLVPYFSMPC